MKSISLPSFALAFALACQSESSVDERGSETESDATTDAGTDTATDSSTDGIDAGTDTASACMPELESLRLEIFVEQCTMAGCHAGAMPAAGLDFEAADLEAELIGIPGEFCDGTIRVIPQQPEQSLLYTKVAGPVPCGAAMPIGGELDEATKACIFDWIAGLDPLSCETCGGAACVDLDTDAANCGACGEACPAGIECVAGACACPEGTEACGDTCLDTQSNPDACGGCDSACPANQVCWQGICADSCAGLTDCGGACVDVQTDPANCGSCGNACAMGSACMNGGCDCPGDGVSFAAEVQPILTAECTGMGCHRAPTNAAGLTLTQGNSYADLVGVASSQCANKDRVVPGQPGASYLMNKLQGVDLCFGTKMPKAGASLSASDIATISEWICRGALNN
ncbi:MXAN_6577-like cysteine-rich protein [Nannocystaceae bacterium ST9]